MKVLCKSVIEVTGYAILLALVFCLSPFWALMLSVCLLLFLMLEAVRRIKSSKVTMQYAVIGIALPGLFGTGLLISAIFTPPQSEVYALMLIVGTLATSLAAINLLGMWLNSKTKGAATDVPVCLHGCPHYSRDAGDEC